MKKSTVQFKELLRYFRRKEPSKCMIAADKNCYCHGVCTEGDESFDISKTIEALRWDEMILMFIDSNDVNVGENNAIIFKELARNYNQYSFDDLVDMGIKDYVFNNKNYEGFPVMELGSRATAVFDPYKGLYVEYYVQKHGNEEERNIINITSANKLNSEINQHSSLLL